MQKGKYIFDKKFKQNWKNYVLQTLAASLVIFIALLIFHMQNLVIVASIGASAFIIFAMPSYPTARSRNLIGGHSVALVLGSLCGLIPVTSFFLTTVIDGLTVGLSIFIMAITETEHPPAAGTALGVAVTGFSLDIVIAVLLTTAILSFIHIYLRNHLKDLV